MRDRVARLLPALLAAAALVLGVVGGFAVVELERERFEATVDARVAQGAASVEALLAAELGQPLMLVPGVRSLIVYDPALSGVGGGDGVVDRALAEVYDQARHLRNIGLAPGNVIAHVHPLAGNEAAIGLRYEDVPAQWPDVVRAMVTGETVLAGPVDLVQGGRGVISRSPVVLADGSYWGIISVVVDVDSVVAAVSEGTADTPIDWAVRTADTADAPGTPVAGEQDLFGRPDAIVSSIDVPGGRWEVVSVASADARADAPPIGLFQLAVVLGSTLLAALMLAVASQRRRLVASSLHDPLTGLPNRRLLDERVELAVRGVARGRGCAVLVLDLDGFKDVNDALGHAAGDRALQEAARRLLRSVRPGDTVARLGGDEFVVILPDTPLRAVTGEIAPRVLRSLSWRFTHGAEEWALTATIGVAHALTHADSASELLRVADAALYRGKRAGRAQVVVGTSAPAAPAARGGPAAATVPAPPPSGDPGPRDAPPSAGGAPDRDDEVAPAP